MKIGKRTFNPDEAISEAKAGNLRGADLRKAIKLAEDFGKTDAAIELKLYLLDSTSFAGDSAPREVRERAAQGISALTAMGHPLTRTKQMLKKHGVIETINRIARYPNSTKNFDRLREAKLEHLTAEAIILDFLDLFDHKAIEMAHKRLGR